MSDSDFNKREFDTAKSELANLLRRLDPDPQRAAEGYESLRRRLLKFFEWNKMVAAEDLADDVLDRVAKKIQNQDISNIDSYTLGVARHVAHEEIRKRQRKEAYAYDPASLESPQNPEREIVQRLDEETRGGCLRECLAKLRADDRKLIVDYYSGEGEKVGIHRQKLANSTGMTINALRVRANRLREVLERCLSECVASRRKSLLAALQNSEDPSETRGSGS